MRGWKIRKHQAQSLAWPPLVVPFRTGFLNRSRGHVATPGRSCLSQLPATGVWWVEARGAARPPRAHRTPPRQQCQGWNPALGGRWGLLSGRALQAHSWLLGDSEFLRLVAGFLAFDQSWDCVPIRLHPSQHVVGWVDRIHSVNRYFFPKQVVVAYSWSEQ